MLHVNNLIYRVAGRPLFDGATMAVNKGERVGLIGRNGSGKTTLLRLIAGELHADGGSISLPRNQRIGRIAQEAPSGPDSLVETVLAADQERTALLAETKSCTDPHRIAEIHERLATIGADSAPARVARILAGLGFDEATQGRPCAELSVGWRMRVALAGLLFDAPDLLLLDEPTNHLDLEATLWLEGFLKSYPGSLLLVSHDRDLLNRVPRKIAHVDDGKLVLYAGNYDRFERTRTERLERQSAMRTRQLAQRRHTQAFIDRFRYKASKARQAQSRIKALARMESIASVVDQHTVAFTFPTPDTLSPPLLTLDGASAGYRAETPVLCGLNLRIDPDDRIALLGANGNGKSTFMRLIAGRLAPQGGRVVKPGKLRVGYFAQDQAEELDLEATPLQLMARALPLEPEPRLRSQLARFGFSFGHAETQTGNLSGGEKARLLFALMTREAPHILLLDEPTNHLDVDAREALVQAINAFEGAVVLVSHDSHLIDLTADRLWLVAEGTVAPFDGDLEDYRSLVQDQRRAERAKARAETINDAPAATSRKERRRVAAQARADVAHLRRAARQAESQVEKLTKEKTVLEARLADPAVYQGPTAQLMALQVKFGEIKRALDAAEDTWLQALEALRGIVITP